MKRVHKIGNAFKRSIAIGALTLSVSALPFYSANALDDGALPSGGSVTGGSASLNYGDNRLDIHQTTDRAIIEWNSFNIGAGATTQFHQPGSGSLAVNRITGGGIDPTMILGSLIANGQVIVLDPNGVIFGQDSVIDVGGIIASTGKINDQAFMAGSPTLDITDIDTGGAIINEGTITVAQAGIAAFVAPTVVNRGVIQAKLGKVSLASGDKATLDLYGDGLVEIAVDGSTSEALIENTGEIRAEGGTVLMTAQAAGQAINSLVNLDGLVDVSSVHVADDGQIIVNGGNINVTQQAILDASSAEGGSVELYAQDRTYVAGSIFAGGGDGGFIETSAAGTVDIADSALINTGGGTWLIDPTDFTIADSGGNITTATLAAQLASNNITIETATAGSDAGDIFVDSALSWTGANTLTLRAHRNIEVNQAITNTTGGSLLLRADKEGSGTGTVTFGASGAIALSGGGQADLYYNPTAYTAPTDYSGNITGTNNAWMLVNNVTQLQAMNTNLAGAYALGKDIDASGSAAWNAGAGFSPVGTNATKFTGKFDGLGHTITDLTINRPATDYIGLFGAANGALVRNVGLLDVSVTGKDYIGALFGYNEYTTIYQSYSTGSVSGASRVGGITGSNNTSSNFYSNYSTATVNSSGHYVGGLAGGNWNSAILRNSYSTGTVTGLGQFTGGLSGINGNSATITDSYATGSVSGTTNVGGLVGTNGATLTKSYATGSVSGTSNVGGLVGANTGTVTNSYWNTQTSGRATSAGGTGLTTAQMKQMANFSGWSIRNSGGTGTAWRIYEGDTYPLLASFLNPLTISADNVTVAYTGTPWSGGSASYSGFENGDDASDLSGTGTLAYGGAAQGAKAPGSYAITISGDFYSGQQGYDIKYLGGTLTIQSPPPQPQAEIPQSVIDTATSKSVLVSEIHSSPKASNGANSGHTEASGCLAAVNDGACIVR
ncbi:MAG TPA: filamentous hemagglutinin N-terminal domain-containing protein [Micavibrio sp.]|nr:filamentous hemagglutinin N-terminal domain-containing protein [Micavibrio sp.]